MDLSFLAERRAMMPIVYSQGSGIRCADLSTAPFSREVPSIWPTMPQSRNSQQAQIRHLTAKAAPITRDSTSIARISSFPKTLTRAVRISVTLPARAASNKKLADLSVSFPASTPGSDSQCTNADSEESSVLELGLPFFSLAYFMVPSLNSPLYLTLPNTYDLPPLPAVFSPNQTLVAPSRPPSPPAAATSSSVAGHVRVTAGLLHAIGACTLTLLL